MIVCTSVDNLNAINQQSSNQGYVLKGLSRQKIGFIVSGPDVGKGYLCLSIAYELATGLNIVGLKGSSSNLRTLYWPIEDGMYEVSQRMLRHFNAMPDDLVAKISGSVMLWDSIEPLCAIRGGIQTPEYRENKAALVQACKNVDLLIIDTLREAVGNADEVDDDQIVKKLLQDIAIEADVAVLVVHHLTKAVIRGTEKISNVSGSGFSRTQANSRMHLYLEKVDGKSGEEDKCYLSHIKANYVPKSERANRVPLYWTENSLICLGKDSLFEPASLTGAVSVGDGELSSEQIEQLISKKRVIPETEPREINLSAALPSAISTQKRAEREQKFQVLNESDREQLRRFNERRSRDQK